MFKVGGLNYTILPNDLYLIKELITRIYFKITELFELLNNSKIWKLRMENVGNINKLVGINYSLSGPVLRSSGLNIDQRLIKPYETFNY